MSNIKELLNDALKRQEPKKINKELIDQVLSLVGNIERKGKSEGYWERYTLYKLLVSLICGWDTIPRNDAFYDQNLYDDTILNITHLMEKGK